MTSTSTSLPSGQPTDPTQVIGDGQYDGTVLQDDTSLKAQLKDHLDSATTRSLQSSKRSLNTMRDAVERNPKSAGLALVGVAALVGASVWLLRSMGRNPDL